MQKGLKRSNDILREGALHSKDSHTQGKGSEEHQGQDSRMDRERHGRERAYQPQQQEKQTNQTGESGENKRRLRLDERANCHHQHLRPTEVEYESQRKEVVP